MTFRNRLDWRSRWFILAFLPLFCLSCALLLPAPVHAAVPGQVNLVRNATSSFDGYTSGATPTQRQWIDAHYSSMRGYAPYFNQALSWAPPTDFYKDLYAIYPQETGLISQHSDWVLKDGAGHNLYIPYDCNGSSCTQYAADVGNPEFRQYWINEAKSNLAKGYKGIFIDDVNMEMKVGNASGTLTAPIDPRTGRPMTETDWRRYVAEFTEEIRRQLPDANIVHNTVWWEDQSDPYVQREIRSADTIELERGFTDTGLTGGFGKFGFLSLLSHIDWLHSLGKSVTLEPYLSTPSQREFELASYFLINKSSDSIASDYQTDPDNFWSGWEVNLGHATGSRYEWNGLFRRNFEGGFVLVNPPEGRATTVALGGQYTELDGGQVSSVTLGERRGVVLTSPTFVAAEGPAVQESQPVSEESPTPAPAPKPAPVPVPAPVQNESQTVADSSSPLAPSGSATVSGEASSDAGSDVVLTLERRDEGHWTRTRVVRITPHQGGHFSKRLRHLALGQYRVFARATGPNRGPVVLNQHHFAVGQTKHGSATGAGEAA